MMNGMGKKKVHTGVHSPWYVPVVHSYTVLINYIPEIYGERVVEA